MSEFTEGPSDYLTIQFLEWLSERPRTYGDAMGDGESRPRFSIWEDALSAGLIRLGHGSFRGKTGHYHGARSISPSQPPSSRAPAQLLKTHRRQRGEVSRGDDQRRTCSPATRRGA